jgi:hypothetical protein
MINDRITVGNRYLWVETKKADGTYEMVMVYSPLLKEDGSQQYTPDGSVIVQRQGGVLVGSTGVIKGDPITVHASYLHDYQGPTAYGGNDLVKLVPIFLDKYQKLGWFPVDNIRIYSGSK